MASVHTKALFEQVLFYLDGPQLISLSMGDKSKVVAVATDNIARHGFFGAKVSVHQFCEYLNERFDLRFLMAYPDRHTWFEFDLPVNNGDIVDLTPVDLTKARINSFLPDHGIFARDHSEDYKSIVFPEQTVQRFNVDGKWDMKEFGKFHSYVSDLYSLSRSIDLFLDEQVEIDRKRKVMASFVKPWEGGGSYYGFFRSLSAAGGRDYRPDIKAIQWASPGHIDIVGEHDSFEKLKNLLRHYGKNRKAIVENYDHLWSYLHEMNLLKSSSKHLDRKSAIAIEVGERAKLLSRSLNITSYRTMKKMAGNDTVVAGKVLLAAQRRSDKLYKFFIEGRAAIAGEEI